MSNLVRMLSNTVFQNDRVALFTDDAPDGVLGATAGIGSVIGADVAHARELHKLGIATPENPADLDVTPAPLEPHYTVSVPELRASQDAAASATPLSEPAASAVNPAPVNDSSAPLDLTNSGAIDARSEPIDLDGMTNAKLREYAAANGIELGEANSKAELVAAIKAGLVPAAQ